MAHGRVPGTRGPATVDAATLAAFAQRQFTRALADDGFEPLGPLLFAKTLEGLVQLIEFELGAGKMAGLYNVCAGWRIALYDQPADLFHVRKHLGMIDNGADRWFGRGGPDEFADVERMIADSALPFLVRHDSIKKLLRLHDRAGYKHMGMFGEGDPWIELHIGLCAEHEEKWDDARRHLKLALAAKQNADSAPVPALANAALARIAAQDGEDPQRGAIAPLPKRRNKYQRKF